MAEAVATQHRRTAQRPRRRRDSQGSITSRPPVGPQRRLRAGLIARGLQELAELSDLGQALCVGEAGVELASFCEDSAGARVDEDLHCLPADGRRLGRVTSVGVLLCGPEAVGR